MMDKEPKNNHDGGGGSLCLFGLSPLSGTSMECGFTAAALVVWAAGAGGSRVMW